MTDEWSLADGQAEHERPEGGTGPKLEHRDPEWKARAVPEVGGASQVEHDAASRDRGRSRHVIHPAAVGDRPSEVGLNR